MLVRARPTEAIQVVKSRNASTVSRLMQILRDPHIEACIADNRELIDQDSIVAGVDSLTFERQVRLHLPSVSPAKLRAGKYRSAYGDIRAIALVRAACIGQERERAELLANTSLLWPKSFKCKKELTLEADDGQQLPLRFGPVKPSIGHVYQARLHYLRAPRGDTHLHFGIFLPGAEYPLTYVALSVCDRLYMVNAITAKQHGHTREDCLVLTRMYGLPGIPANLMSVTIKQLIRVLRRGRDARLLITAYNPLLGFRGVAFYASGFHPFAVAPATYSYTVRGEYTTRRVGRNSIRSRYQTPPNVLMARGIDKHSQRELIGLVQLINISDSEYHYGTAVGGVLPDVRHPEWLGQLRSYRSVLEAAWSQRTIHPSYLAEPRPEVSSRGQCGVSSVWLARELRRRFGVDATYCYGDLSFADSAARPVNHHCWIEIGKDPDPARLVIDITSDQAESLHQPVLCGTYQELCKRGLVYEARSRLTLDQLPSDRVWHRFEALEEAIAVNGSHGK